MDNLAIREAVQADARAIESIYPQSFPSEDLLPLVLDLMRDAEIATSLVATVDAEIVGHIVFSKCGVLESDARAALLGPLAVAPAWQGQGIGGAMVREGLQWQKDKGVDVVCVLGDPAYYHRHGFEPEPLIEPPYPLPAEWAGAWQSRYLNNAKAPCAGKLAVPPQWLEPALWAP